MCMGSKVHMRICVRGRCVYEVKWVYGCMGVVDDWIWLHAREGSGVGACFEVYVCV